MIQITCPQCDTNLAEQHVNDEANIVTCNMCHAVFSTPDKNPDAIARRNRKMPAQPAHFSLRTNEGTILIAFDDIDKRNRMVLFLAVLSIVAMVRVFWVYSDRAIDNNISLFLTCAMFLWFLFNVFLTITGLRFANNRVTISVEKETLRVYNMPIQFPSPMHMGTKEISQVFVKEAKDNRKITYGVYVKTHYGKVQPLVGGFKSPSPALFIEHQIEKFLRIRDRATENEYRPSQKKANS